MAIESEIADLRFDALRNAIYHTARRLFLDKWNKRLNLIVILAGAGVMGQVGTKLGIGTSELLLGFTATFAGTLQLVFDLGVKARNHEFLQRSYYELLADIAVKPQASEADLATWQARLQRLYAEEPPPLRALDAVAYNAACDTLGKDHGRVEVTPWQSFVRHVYPFNGTSFPYVKAEKDRLVGSNA